MATAYFSGDSRYYIDYNVTLVSQEVNNNRSKIRRTLVMHKSGSGTGDYSGSAVSHWASWGPTTHGWHYFTFDFRNYTSLTLMNHEEWVGHNNDGTLTFHSSAQVNADLSTGTPSNRQASVGFNVTLPTIPRATTPNITGGGGFTTGTATTINLPRAASGFTHDVSYSIGTKSGTIATGAGVTASWTPPHTLMTELPNAASGQVKITVVTKNGSTTIGTKDVNFSLTAGSSVVPSITEVVWDDNNTTVKTKIGAFVQGLSLVKGAVTALGDHGATIASKSIVIGGQTFPENTAFLVNGSGTVPATAQATDSRGRTNTLATSFSVLPYLPPQVGSNGWQVRRANDSNVADDNGQYLRIDLHIIATSLVVGTEKNALHISVRTRPLNGAWTQRNVENPGLTQNGAIHVTGGGAFLTSQSYEVEITITDNTSAPAMVLKKTVGTTVVTLDLRDSRVGIGKMHENGQLDVAGDIHSTGKFFSNGVDMSAAASITSGTLAAARLPAATETAIGAVERATQAEVDSGTDATRYVSPATLRALVNKQVFFTAWKSSAQTVASGDVKLTGISAAENYGGFTLANNQVTIPFTGWYDVQGSITYWSIAGDHRSFWLKNATNGKRLTLGQGTSNWRMYAPRRRVLLTAGDKIEAWTGGSAAMSLQANGNPTTDNGDERVLELYLVALT